LRQTEQTIGTEREPTCSLLVDRTVELASLVSQDLAKFRSKAYQQLGNTHDAEDAVQDALVSAFEHLAEFEGRSLLSTWLTTIVINAARLQRRRRLVKALIDPQFGSEDLRTALEETIADERPGPDEILARLELYRLMAELMKGLSPSLRNTIRHYYVDGMTAAEVAGMLDIPVGTVKARIWRARARLRQALNARKHMRIGRGFPG
jgi:RNA polymerase sigma-70 factor, ECF subfamily